MSKLLKKMKSAGGANAASTVQHKGHLLPFHCDPAGLMSQVVALLLPTGLFIMNFRGGNVGRGLRSRVFNGERVQVDVDAMWNVFLPGLQGGQPYPIGNARDWNNRSFDPTPVNDLVDGQRLRKFQGVLLGSVDDMQAVRINAQYGIPYLKTLLGAAVNGTDGQYEYLVEWAAEAFPADFNVDVDGDLVGLSPVGLEFVAALEASVDVMSGTPTEEANAVPAAVAASVNLANAFAAKDAASKDTTSK